MQTASSSPYCKPLCAVLFLTTLFLPFQNTLAQTPSIASARLGCPDNYGVFISGNNFATNASVDVRQSGSHGTIIDAYSGSAIQRRTENGVNHLGFVITKPSTRTYLNDAGLWLWVVNPSVPSWNGPVAVKRTTPSTPSSLTAAANNYSVLISGLNFESGAVVDVRSSINGPIIAQYSGLNRTVGCENDRTTLRFDITDSLQRNYLTSSGLYFYVVNPTSAKWAGPIHLTSVIQNNPPTTSLSVSPTGELKPRSQVTLSATATDSDGSISSVSFFKSGVLIGTISKAPYTITTTIDAPGKITLSARSTDNLGAHSSLAAKVVDIGPAIAIGGSNLVWYHVGPNSPAGANACFREDYAIINDYHRQLPSTVPGGTGRSVRDHVRSLLSSMRAAGQDSISTSLFLTVNVPQGYGAIDSFGVGTATLQSFYPTLSAKYIENLKQYILDAKSAGFGHVSVRFVWAGSDAPYLWYGNYRTEYADAWILAISDVKRALASVGLDIQYDLGGELMPTIPTSSSSSPEYSRDRNWNRWASDLWAWYSTTYGVNDSVGFSIPTGVFANFPISTSYADLESRIRNTVNVYGSRYPRELSIHIYEEPALLFRKADAVLDSMGKPAIPIKIGETFQNNSIVSQSLRSEAMATARPISRVIQWPLLGQQRSDTVSPNCDHVNAIPLEYANFRTAGF